MADIEASVATCIRQANYPEALTRGKHYAIVAYNSETHTVRVRGDNGRTRWFPAYCFDLTGQPCPVLASFSLDDPIHDPYHDCIEVTVHLSNGEARWCFFVTPLWLATALTQGPPAKVLEKQGLRMTELTYLGTSLRTEDGTPFGIVNVPHMVVISELSEATVGRALHYIDNQGELHTSTYPLRA